jgi:hypothetical protein
MSSQFDLRDFRKSVPFGIQGRTEISVSAISGNLNRQLPESPEEVRNY